MEPQRRRLSILLAGVRCCHAFRTAVPTPASSAEAGPGAEGAAAAALELAGDSGFVPMSPLGNSRSYTGGGGCTADGLIRRCSTLKVPLLSPYPPRCADRPQGV